MTVPGGQASLNVVVGPLAVGQALPPPIVVDHDVDVIGVVEGCRAASEHRVVEGPFRRGRPPDELGKFVPVLFVARASANSATAPRSTAVVPRKPRREGLGCLVMRGTPAEVVVGECVQDGRRGWSSKQEQLKSHIVA